MESDLDPYVARTGERYNELTLAGGEARWPVKEATARTVVQPAEPVVIVVQHDRVDQGRGDKQASLRQKVNYVMVPRINLTKGLEVRKAAT